MTTEPTTPTAPVRMIPARALSLPELEEIVRVLVDIANKRRESAEELILELDGINDPKVGA